MKYQVPPCTQGACKSCIPAHCCILALAADRAAGQARNEGGISVHRGQNRLTGQGYSRSPYTLFGGGGGGVGVPLAKFGSCKHIIPITAHEVTSHNMRSSIIITDLQTRSLGLWDTHMGVSSLNQGSQYNPPCTQYAAQMHDVGNKHLWHTW